ncbi:MAG TPA: NADH-quinone oxidoreductase subunit F, partial [Ruminococcaceae bacterium]|nr:NADH-quinone oxidoreductase subunit F [Oscillospiraceae bacterium]
MKAEMVKSLQDLLSVKNEYLDELSRYERQILVCGGAGCVSSGCAEIQQELRQALEEYGLAGKTKVVETG